MTEEKCIPSENLKEIDHLKDLDLGKRIIKFWKELLSFDMA
jgi:hypothetical protein